MAQSVYVPMTRQARDALVAVSVLWVVCALVVTLRIVGRFRGAGVSVDDVLSFFALLFACSTIGLNAAVFTSGVGVDFDPTAEVYPKLLANMSYILLITFTFTLIYVWTLACLKLSQLYLYWRVFSTQIRIWIFATAAIVVAWAIIFTFIFIFLCNPINQQWSLMRTGHCMDQILVLKSLIMTNILTDLLIFILPIKSVWQLNMRKTEKLAVISCFALGAACVIIGVVRFWQIFVIDLIGNLTGTSLTTFMLCSIELMLAGLCINIPTLRPFYLQWRAKHKSYADGSNEHYDSGFKSSGSKSARGHPLTGGQTGQGHSTWIELDDKDQETIHDGDADSERHLTRKQPDAIVVSKNWSVT